MELLGMKSCVLFLCATVLSVVATGCGGSASDRCTITANVSPASASADHNAGPPGNQVQFSTTSSTTGNCPLAPDTLGSWSTSDPVNTRISNQAGTNGLATCIGATTTPAMISNSGTVRSDKGYTTATLTCR
jgi:hypothetical protein